MEQTDPTGAYRKFLQLLGAASCEEGVGFMPLEPIPGAYPSGRIRIDLLYGLSEDDAFDEAHC